VGWLRSLPTTDVDQAAVAPCRRCSSSNRARRAGRGARAPALGDPTHVFSFRCCSERLRPPNDLTIRTRPLADPLFDPLTRTGSELRITFRSWWRGWGWCTAGDVGGGGDVEGLRCRCTRRLGSESNRRRSTSKQASKRTHAKTETKQHRHTSPHTHMPRSHRVLSTKTANSEWAPPRGSAAISSAT
jgi:hypothetical protein